MGPRVSGPRCKACAQDVSVPRGTARHRDFLAPGERDWRVSTLHRPLCLNRQTDTRASAARRIGSGAAGRKRRAASQSSELRKERQLLEAVFELPEHSKTRSVLERASRSQVVATHSRDGEPLDSGRTVGSESLKALYERESRRGHCVGVNAAATADIWARDPDVHCADAPPLFERGSETSKASAPCGGLKVAVRVAYHATGTSNRSSSTDG